jgi:hypothetical protein
MGIKEMGTIKALGENIEHFAGKTIRAKVMAGSEQLAPKSTPAEIATWLKGAMERLDKLVSKEKRVQIRENCGYACARINKRTLDRGKAKRKKYPSLDEFLAAEQKKPLTGTKLEKKGDVLFWYFTPGSFSRPMRCFCALMKGLPEDEKMSPTYCLCSRGFVQKYWEGIVGKPLTVELLDSCLTGARECKFVIHL